MDGLDEAETLGEKPQQLIEGEGEEEELFERRLLQVYTGKWDKDWPNKFESLIQEQSSRSDKPSTPPKLAIGYIENNRHTGERTWETNERTAAIYSALKSAGILDASTSLDITREATKEQITTIHSEELWIELLEFHKEAEEVEADEEKREAYLEEMYNKKSLFFNTWTVVSALLAVGSVFTGIDHCMLNLGAALLLIRPPGVYHKSFLSISGT